MGRGKRRAAAVCRAGSAAGTETEAGGHESHLQHIALQSENLTREIWEAKYYTFGVELFKNFWM